MPKTNLAIAGWHPEIIAAVFAPPRNEAEALHQRYVFLCAGWFFLAVTLILAASVVHSQWRQHWRWGTKKFGAPMTSFGRLAWIFAFAVCSASCFVRGLGTENGALILVLMFAAFALLLSAAWYDSWRFRQQKASDQKPEIARPLSG